MGTEKECETFSVSVYCEYTLYPTLCEGVGFFIQRKMMMRITTAKKTIISIE